jgi:exosortase/archaeosortase family protein
VPKKHKSHRKPRPEKRGFAFGDRFRSALTRTKTFVRENRTAVRSGAIFAGCMLAFLLAYGWIADSQAMDGIKIFTAKATAFFLNLFRYHVTTDDTLISSSKFQMGIVTGCTALIPTAIFIAAVLAYPCRIRDKIIGILFGIVAIGAVNLVRTVTLFFIGTHFSESVFETAHLLIWQSLVILISIGLWLLWAQKLVRVPAKQ